VFYINQVQLKQLESLLTQSTMGIHILFDNLSLAEILGKPTENVDFFTHENLGRIQAILGEFLQKSDLDQKMLYLQALDQDSYELLVRSYFNIVENTVLEATKLKH